MNTSAWLRQLGRTVLAATALATLGCASDGDAGLGYTLTPEVKVPAPPREFRAGWIATVHNIDWPSKPGLPVEQQKAELIELLDCAKRVGLNAVIFQVRPTCDAFYRSDLEPWSRYLTGKPGKAPEPFYDPLEFAVEEAHARGLELHAWFNPYRARPGEEEPPPAKGHVTHAESPLAHAVRPYGKLLLLDPGLPEVREYSRSVMVDVATRYDVDGIHMDDYFYPYPLKRPDGSEVRFPDEKTHARLGKGVELRKWRRENVDTFVRELGPAVHAKKPWVKVGIAPFGIWRPKHPPVVRGMDAHEKLGTDTRGWLAKGWLDYFSPQLYWATYFPEQPFDALLQWWEAQNETKRHLWPGISTRWIKSKRDPKRDASEILEQIRLTRTRVAPERPGHIHWNLSALEEDRGDVVAALRAGPYTEAALVPASPWLKAPTPGPVLEASASDTPESGVQIGCKAPEGARWIALQVQDTPEGQWRLVSARRPGATWSLPKRPYAFALTAVGANGTAGPGRAWIRQ